MYVPRNRAGQFFFFGAIEFVSFFLIVANNRAVAQGNYMWTAVTDGLFGLQGFAVFKMAIDDPNARTWASGLGSTVGGTLGSMFSIWLTKRLYGQ